MRKLTNLSEKILCIVLLLNTFMGFAQKKDSLDTKYQYFQVSEDYSYGYTKPRFFDMFLNVPKDLKDFGGFLIKKENTVWIGASVGSTLALIPFDQKLLDNAQELGEPIGLADDVRYIRVLGLELVPQDINGAIYYLGYGLTPILISAGFYVSGLISDDYRALNTSSEIIQVLMSSGIAVQAIKRITGRQSPSAAISSGNPGGHWTPFPSFKAYQTNTPEYDAIPSGHLTTFMATLTILATNYPEIKWIKPVGYSLMGVLAFQMMSSRVHWASDYPIAILMGYAIGKSAANNRITKKRLSSVSERKTNYKTNFTYSKIDGVNVVGVNITF
jgi:hypothetical protein